MSDEAIDILHVTSAHAVRDTRIFVKHAKSLSQAGYHTGVLGPGDVAQNLSEQGVNLITLPCPKGRLGRFVWFRQTLFRRIRALCPKVVHLHDPDLLLMVPRLKRAGFKVIYDAHEDFSQAPLSRDWLGPNWVRVGVARRFDRLERRLAQCADAVVVADKQLEPRFPGASVVRNYLIASEWPEPPPRDRGGVVRCIYVGDITRARGVFEMCDAVQVAWEHGIAIKLDLVGRLAPDLKARLGAHPARPHISIHGPLPRVEVAQRLAQADVGLCLPEPFPAYQDSLPVKLLEYLAMKLPAVVTDTPRLRKETALAPGLFLVPWGRSAPLIVTAIRSAYNLGSEARNSLRTRVLSEFDWALEEKALLSLYGQVLPMLETKEVHAA